MKTSTGFLARSLSVLIVFWLSGCSTVDGFRQEVSSGKPETQKPLVFKQPQLSVRSNQAASLDNAYQAQTVAVKAALHNQAPSGFKAGLTTKAGQEKFKLNAPIAGVLWPNGRLPVTEDVASTSLQDYRIPRLEVELAFRVNRLIPEPLADVAEAQKVVSEVMPAFELPDLGFESEVGVTGYAVIAANAAARYFVLGDPVPVHQVDINAVSASLYLDGKYIDDAEATRVMGNQWKALYWLINTMVEQGWVIQPGQVLMTGAMGEMLPLQAGYYEARFSGLSNIGLNVTDQ